MVDAEGVEAEVLIPRFRCRGRGPGRPRGRSFSVLPEEVIPRRRWSLGFVLKVALWCQDSLRVALDRLSRQGKVVEARQLRRWLEVLGSACERLHQHPLPGLEIEVLGGRLDRAVEVERARRALEGRGPPGGLVLAWQESWQASLLDVKLS